MGGKPADEWLETMAAYERAHPEARGTTGRTPWPAACPEGWQAALPVFEAGDKIATRSASGKVLNALASVLPTLIGGSADLAPSNNTYLNGERRLPGRRIRRPQPALRRARARHGRHPQRHGAARRLVPLRRYVPRVLRLHAAGHTPGRPLQGSRGVRLHARQHRSGGGWSHPPAHRAPGVPAGHAGADGHPAQRRRRDGRWPGRSALERRDGPTALVLTRQNLPSSTATSLAPAEGCLRGGYVLSDAGAGRPDVIVIGTGSEVGLALEAQALLAADRASRRGLSPCRAGNSSRSRTRPIATRSCRPREGPGGGGGGLALRLGALRGRSGAWWWASTTSAPRPRPRCSIGSSASPRRTWPPRPWSRSRGRPARADDRLEEG